MRRLLATSIGKIAAGVCQPACLLAAVLLWGGARTGAADEWRNLVNGSDLGGWTHTEGWQTAQDVTLADDPGRFKLQPGEGILVNGPAGKGDDIRTEAEFGDLELHVEFNVPSGSNSGVYLQGRYEIQILDSWQANPPKFSDCGGIYQRWNDKTATGYEGHAPAENASLPPGQWQSFDIVFKAARFDSSGRKTANARLERVVHNGKLIHEHVEVTGPTRASQFQDELPLGPLVFQGVHGPVAIRNVLVRTPSGAEQSQAALGTGKPLWPGVQPAGDVLLPNQWSLRPVGRQVRVGDFPVNIALHPSGNWAAVLHAGYGEHEIVVVELERLRIVSRVTIEQAFCGMCFNPAGDRVYASGAEHEVVHEFSFREGYLSQARELPVGSREETFVPAGVTCAADGSRLFVANAWGGTVCVLPVDEPDKRRHIPLGPGSYPYASIASDDGRRLYVSLWGKSALAVVDLEKGEVITRWETESHPTELALSPDGERLFVSCANSNTVWVFDAAAGRAQEVIKSALFDTAPTGSTPNSIALAADGKALFVANADNNNVAVFDVSDAGRARSLGFIPVGWYPTSVRYDDRRQVIYVANGKGLTSLANPQGPQPLTDPPVTVEQYIGGLYRGTLSVIAVPDPQTMAGYTRDAYQCSPLREDLAPVVTATEPGHPIPAKKGDPSPIKYCIYIIKENRTYDQVFGDMPEGNGDPNLCIFGEQVTPNHHALARRFVLLDNFYVESEVSADGHEWSMAAYATDFVEKSWPLVYRGGNLEKIKYPSEGEVEGNIARPAGGYIWDRCAAAGVSYRSYGEFVSNAERADQPATTRVAALQGHFDPLYRSYDLDYLDAHRVDRFLVELAEFEKSGQVPQFIVLRLPNDHTYGTRPGKPTPTAMVAENDLALGRFVEAISNSSFWPETAIFVVEDDAQNGSDHVDAHRTVALVISPYVKRGAVDSSMYSTSSMLRTMELILGLDPMSQFDAAARPMIDSFTVQASLEPFAHLPARVDLNAVNPPHSWGAQASMELDLSREDAADDLVFNEIIWRSVRGPDSVMPPPVRASFVFSGGEEEEEEDEVEVGTAVDD